MKSKKQIMMIYTRINGVETVKINTNLVPVQPKKAGMKVLFTAQDILAGRV